MMQMRECVIALDGARYDLSNAVQTLQWGGEEVREDFALSVVECLSISGHPPRLIRPQPGCSVPGSWLCPAPSPTLAVARPVFAVWLRARTAGRSWFQARGIASR